MRTVFDRRYVGPCAGIHDRPGPCLACGRELVMVAAKRYCSLECRRQIKTLPLPEREARREAAPLGRCVGCGCAVELPRYQCRRGRNAWLKAWRRAAGGQLRFGPDAREWLAARLGLEPDDERLPQIARTLANAGKLTIAVDGERVLGVAKVRGKL